MSNAEQRAFERYPDYREMDGEYVTQIHKRKVFAEGYHQAEEDNKLSWKDIKVIERLLGFDNIIESPKEYYQEVLKRFKDLKKGKRNENVHN
jgi:hypothetical protein